LARKKKKPTRRATSWTRWPDDRLLDTRLCDLRLTLSGGLVPAALRELEHELAARSILFRPHWWLSDCWFCPDGVPGFAIPFYLAHPRLEKLEQQYMLEAEGGTAESCLKILRHETAHALANAYRLHLKQVWRRRFGRASRVYPESYLPRPGSRNYVIHLDNWYAQSHPAEDWAETFAVWLDPHSRWRERYHNWPALKKLEYVDTVMQEIRGSKPVSPGRCSAPTATKALPSFRRTRMRSAMLALRRTSSRSIMSAYTRASFGLNFSFSASSALKSRLR